MARKKSRRGYRKNSVESEEMGKAFTKIGLAALGVGVGIHIIFKWMDSVEKKAS